MAAVTKMQNWRGSWTNVYYFKNFPDKSDVMNVDDTPSVKKGGCKIILVECHVLILNSNVCQHNSRFTTSNIFNA